MSAVTADVAGDLVGEMYPVWALHLRLVTSPGAICSEFRFMEQPPQRGSDSVRAVSNFLPFEERGTPKAMRLASAASTASG